MKTKYIIKTKILLLLFAVFAINGNAQTFDWETATLFNTGCTNCAAEQTIGSNYVSFRATNSSVIHLSNAGQGTTGLSVRNSQPQPETYLTFYPSVNVQSLRLFATANNQNWTISQLDNAGNVLNTMTTNVNIASAVATLNWTNVHQIEIKVTAGLNQSFGLDDVVFTPYTPPCTVNIPDANFKNYLVGNTNINTNGDTEIQCSEASAYTLDITVQNLSITDLTGIEAFTNLTELFCNNNSLTSLDVSNNTSLTKLWTQSNSLASLDVSNNTLLEDLSFGNNSISNIDVSNNTALIYLYAYTNPLTNIDLSSNINLETLWVHNTSISNIDVSSNTNLYHLWCFDTLVTSIDISSNTTLSYLDCKNNSQLTSLNVANGNNSNFNGFYAQNNPNLTCITVDDTAYSTTNWTNIDAQTSFSTNCNISSTTWTGTTSDDWNTPTNWTNGVPTIITNAIIPNGTPNNANVNTLLAVTNNLEIQTGANLTINSEKSLTIEGDLTINNNGSIQMSSIAEQSASLILKGIQSGTGKILFSRGLTNNWHLLSSPVIGQDMADSDITSNLDISGVKYALAPYNNSLPTSRYTYYTTAAGTNNINNAGNFLVGKGYAVKRDGAGYYLGFTGTLNTSDVSIAITDGSTTGNKWNLVGNPFTASINGNSNADATYNFLTVNANQLDPARAAMYVWNSATSSYDIINQATAGSKYIAPGQGFFVEAKNGGGTIQFTEDMQSHQTGNIFSRSTNTIPSIKIMVTDGNLNKSTEVKYLDNTTIDLDPGYDAGTFSGESTSFNVFTRLVSNTTKTDFALQCLPNSKYEAMVIPVGVNTKENSTLSFFVNVENLPKGINVYLEDKLNKIFTQIDKESHTVSFEAKENGVGRFYIHTAAKKPTNLVPVTINELNVFVSKNNTLKVLTKEQNQKATVKIFNVLGQEIFSKSFTSKGTNELILPKVSAGIHIVRLVTDKEGTLNKKVLIK